MLSIPRLWRSRTGGTLIVSRVIARGTFTKSLQWMRLDTLGYQDWMRCDSCGVAWLNPIKCYHIYIISLYTIHIFIWIYNYSIYIYIYIVSQWNRSTNFMHLDVNLNPSTDSYTRCPVALLSNRTRMGFVSVTNVNPCRRTKIIAQFLF